MGRIPKAVKRANRLKRIGERMRIHEREVGTGRFVYRNQTKGDLMLPKAAEGGNKGPIPPGETWVGDSYFMYMVKTTNEASLVEDLNAITEPALHNIEAEKELTDILLKEENNMVKLILDQPDRITTEGRVELVTAPSKIMPLNEEPTDPTKQKDVLLTEDPMEGIQIILND